MSSGDANHRRTIGEVEADGRYRATLGSDPAPVESVREAICRLAAEAGLADRSGDLALALAEVIANAQEHGRPPVEVTAWRDGRLVVEVTDRGQGFDQAALWRSHPPTPLGRRGRGLWIVRQLTDVVTIVSGPGGTRVRLELSPEPAIGA